MVMPRPSLRPGWYKGGELIRLNLHISKLSSIKIIYYIAPCFITLYRVNVFQSLRISSNDKSPSLTIHRLYRKYYLYRPIDKH